MRNEIRAALEAVANSWIPKTVLGAFALSLAATAAVLDFTHFKRRKRERLQLNGTG